jgi:signal transduction histidine kinase
MRLKQWFKNKKQKHKTGLANTPPEAKAMSASDIMDLSKIEIGKLELNPVKYETASLINEIARLNLMKFENKPVGLKLQVDKNIPSVLLGDELRIKQILNKLISNAAKYTERGRVTLSVSSELGGGAVTLVIKVQDTGLGMSEEQMGGLFDRYNRVSTGLGIVSKLTQIMNGTISVESIPGTGTLFTVRLPQGNTGSGTLGMEVARNLRQFRLITKSRMRYSPLVRETLSYGSVLVE